MLADSPVLDPLDRAAILERIRRVPDATQLAAVKET
jgi:hypothetical protein